MSCMCHYVPPHAELAAVEDGTQASAVGRNFIF